VYLVLPLNISKQMRALTHTHTHAHAHTHTHTKVHKQKHTVTCTKICRLQASLRTGMFSCRRRQTCTGSTVCWPLCRRPL